MIEDLTCEETAWHIVHDALQEAGLITTTLQDLRTQFREKELHDIGADSLSEPDVIITIEESMERFSHIHSSFAEDDFEINNKTFLLLTIGELVTIVQNKLEECLPSYRPLPQRAGKLHQ